MALPVDPVAVILGFGSTSPPSTAPHGFLWLLCRARFRVQPLTVRVGFDWTTVFGRAGRVTGPRLSTISNSWISPACFSTSMLRCRRRTDRKRVWVDPCSSSGTRNELVVSGWVDAPGAERRLSRFASYSSRASLWAPRVWTWQPLDLLQVCSVCMRSSAVQCVWVSIGYKHVHLPPQIGFWCQPRQG